MGGGESKIEKAWIECERRHGIPSLEVEDDFEEAMNQALPYAARWR